MLIFDNDRAALMRDEVINSSDQLTPAIRKLRELSKDAVDLQQMGYRTDARIRLGGAGFSTNVDPSIPQAVIDGTISLFDIAHDPNMREMLEFEMDKTGEIDFLSRLLPASAFDLMRLTRTQQNILEEMQFAESSRRFQEGSIQRAYLRAKGKRGFEGLFAWGLIDHNATNFDIDYQARRVMFLVRFATWLPHIRYESEYNSDFNGSGASIKQSLTVNPRVAFLTDGVDEWYGRVVQDLPAQNP